MPILEDLYNALLTQEEKEAQYIATALEGAGSNGVGRCDEQHQKRRA